MTNTIIGFLFYTIAIILNAFMDSIENEHVWDTIFKGWRQSFWWKRVSASKAKVIFGFKLDAWHIAKHLMIASIIMFALLYDPLFAWYIDFCILGVHWIIVFNIFYNKIFGKK